MTEHFSDFLWRGNRAFLKREKKNGASGWSILVEK